MGVHLTVLFLLALSGHIQSKVTRSIDFPSSQRCGGRNIDEEKCCTIDNPCIEGEGDCEDNDECQNDLVCGNNNCKDFGQFYHEKDDCCVQILKTEIKNATEPSYPATESLPGKTNI